MARQNIVYLAFNRGLISVLAIARIDLKRMALSARVMTNWMARTLGSMMLRPGLGYLGATYLNHAPRFLRFVFSVSDKALIEVTDSILRVLVSDALISRPAVATAIAGGTFPSAASLLANWTDDDEAGCTSAWISAGLVGFAGTGTNAAIRTQAVVVAPADQNVEHALRIVVARGPITLRVGSTAGGDNYITETELGTGTHSLAFTPTGSPVYVRFQSRLDRSIRLQECTIEAAGVMTLPAPWAAADLGLIRYDQSGDILFLASGKTADKIGYQQRKIERRATRSWSIVLFQPEDGPFRVANTGPGTLANTVLVGNGTMASSLPFFKSTHVGALFALTSSGQTVLTTAAGANVFTSTIEVTGVGAGERTFTITITTLSGTGSTVTLQRSIGSPGSWVDIHSYVVNTVVTETDTLDNQIVYYRIGVKAGDYVAGAIGVQLDYPVGSIRGVVRVVGYTSPILVDTEVLIDLGSSAATDNWEEGQWSDARGWPTSVSFYEGRLWWAGKDSFNSSASDDFTDLDATADGDSASISRSIGSGPVDTINWLLPLLRLVGGGVGAEFSARSTTFDEPLTPSNFNLKHASTQGSAPVSPAIIDDTGVYVQRGNTRVYELAFDSNKYDYSSNQLSLLIPEIGQPMITRVDVQRQPDTRIHFVRSDGTVAVCVYDKAEDVKCWLEIEAGGTNAAIEDVVVLPGDAGTNEDQVYYSVARTVNGSTVRYLERWAMEDDCHGATVTKLADSYVTFNQPASTTIGGLTHLIGESVVVWQDGTCPEDANGDPKTFVVSGAGQIVVDTAAIQGVVGLSYTAQWQSAKLAQMQAMLGTSLTMQKIINGLGLIGAWLHRKGVKVGQDFSVMDDLPSVENGSAVSADYVWTEYDNPTFTIPGKWTSDARICLQAKAPRPATICAVVAETQMNE